MKIKNILLTSCFLTSFIVSSSYAGVMCDWFGFMCSDAVADTQEMQEPSAQPEVKAPPAAPKVEAPKVVAPKVVAPEVVAPEVVAPEVVAPEVVAPEVVAPEVVVPKVIAPEVGMPLATPPAPPAAPVQ